MFTALSGGLCRHVLNMDSFTQKSYPDNSWNRLQLHVSSAHELCENVNFDLLYSMITTLSNEPSRVYLRTVVVLGSLLL